MISLLLIAVFALLVQRTRTRNPGVPGPRQLPIIGNLLDILPHAKNRRPGDLFKRVAVEFGPVSQVTLPPGADIVLISDPALARRVLRTDGGKIVKDDEFMKAMDGIAPFGLFALPDGEIWTRHRKKLQPAFGPLHLRHALEIVRRMSSQLYEHCDKLINTGEMERKGTDFYTGFTCAVADVLGHLAFSHDFNNIAALSQPDADRSTYNQLEFLLTVMTKRVFHVSRPFWGLAGVGKSAVKPVGDKVRATLQKVIESRRGNVKRTEKEMDVLDRLLAESEDGEPTFTTDEVMDEVVAFYMVRLIW